MISIGDPGRVDRAIDCPRNPTMRRDDVEIRHDPVTTSRVRRERASARRSRGHELRSGSAVEQPRCRPSDASSLSRSISGGRASSSPTKTCTDPRVLEPTVSTIGVRDPGSGVPFPGVDRTAPADNARSSVPARSRASTSVGSPPEASRERCAAGRASDAISGIAEQLVEGHTGDEEDEDLARSSFAWATRGRCRQRARPRTMNGRARRRRARVTTGPWRARARGGRRPRARSASPRGPGSRGRRGTCPRSRSRRRR